jgi:hypothetical protein
LRYNELLQEAENERLARRLQRTRLDQPGLRERLLVSAGNFLIVSGQWLKERAGVPVGVS